MTEPSGPPKWDPTTQRRVGEYLDRLHADFAGIFAAETIDRYVADSTERLCTARNTTYLPIFVERFARQRLKALAQVQGSVEKTVPEVLFVCVHNAGRSQMAAALLNDRAAGKVHVRSAGSQQADEVDPNVITAMAEVGLDLSHEFPRPLTDEVTRAADVVITMGCGDACPAYPGTRFLDWDLPDPAGQPLEVVRAIRDDIDRRVRGLVGELLRPLVSAGSEEHRGAEVPERVQAPPLDPRRWEARTRAATRHLTASVEKRPLSAIWRHRRMAQSLHKGLTMDDTGVSLSRNPDRLVGPADLWSWWPVGATSPLMARLSDGPHNSPDVGDWDRGVLNPSLLRQDRGHTMAMGQTMQFSGVGIDKYDEVQDALGWHDDIGAPEGLLAHAAGATENGFCVMEWWEAESDWDKFFSERLAPAFEKVGGLPQPHVTRFDVHSTYSRS